MLEMLAKIKRMELVSIEQRQWIIELVDVGVTGEFPKEGEEISIMFFTLEERKKVYKSLYPDLPLVDPETKRPL